MPQWAHKQLEIDCFRLLILTQRVDTERQTQRDTESEVSRFDVKLSTSFMFSLWKNKGVNEFPYKGE